MQLNKIQQRFKEQMVSPAEDREFNALFEQSTGAGLDNRLKVYRNNVIRGLTDTVMAAMPMTQKLVGKDFLEQAVRSYILQNLPERACLNLYGSTFPEFIKTYTPAKNLPYLYDFVRLEWAWENAGYAPDDNPLDPAKLATLNEEDLPGLVFSFRSSLDLIESSYPLDEIVDFCRSEEDEELCKLGNYGVKLMIYRPELKVIIRKLSGSEYGFLKSLRDDLTIHETAVKMEQDFDLTATLQKFLNVGVFSSFRVKK